MKTGPVRPKGWRRQTGRQAGRETARRAGRETDRQADSQRDRQTVFFCHVIKAKAGSGST